MPCRPDILIATNNEGKIREIAHALQGLPVRWRFLSEFPELHSVSEVGNTYEKNATLKALEYSKHTRLCARADDSGLEVHALGGQPGVHSARYGGAGMSDLDRIELLLGSLRQVEGRRRKARFVSSMVLALPSSEGHAESSEVLHVATGFCEGRITISPRGSNGFGYDPVFAPDGYKETFVELSDEVKGRISHRAQALLKMKQFIERWISST
jgi:XTP/dITP diphosphohydrolase